MSQIKFAKIVVLLTFDPFTRKEPPVIGGGKGEECSSFLTMIQAFTRAFSRPASLATRNGALARRLWF